MKRSLSGVENATDIRRLFPITEDSFVFLQSLVYAVIKKSVYIFFITEVSFAYFSFPKKSMVS